MENIFQPLLSLIRSGLQKIAFRNFLMSRKSISCRPAMIIKNLLWKKMLLWQISEERNFYNPGIEDAMEILII